MPNLDEGDWMISVDDHLIEPPNTWTDRLPAKFREEGPRWLADEHGESWLFEGKRFPIGGGVTAGAFPPDKRPQPFQPLRWSEIPASCYDPKARIAAMNTDRVAAALMFPNLPEFSGNLFQRCKNRELALLCIQAYNDWVLDEWCTPYPDRFIGLALVPMWDPKLAAAEAERTIAKGARSVAFSLAPQNIGFPGIHTHGGYWDPLFQVMNDANLPLSSHLGTDLNTEVTLFDMERMSARIKQGGLDIGKVKEHVSKGEDVALAQLADGAASGEPETRQRATRSSTHPRVAGIMTQFGAQAPLLEWIFSGNFDRFPNLKVVLSENGIGWIPAILASADWMLEMSRSRVTQPHDAENNPMFTEEARKMAEITMAARAERDKKAPLPSDVFKKHIYGCFINDRAGLKLLDEIGVDNVMIETDFPHNATWFPHSMEKAQESLAHLPAETRYKILRGNAERLFQLQPAAVPA
jgi:predicted TIM-barrel fold metal-dependent hydrolase